MTAVRLTSRVWIDAASPEKVELGVELKGRRKDPSASCRLCLCDRVLAVAV